MVFYSLAYHTAVLKGTNEAPGRYSRQLTTAAGARGHSIPRARGADFPPPRSPAAANPSLLAGGAPPVSSAAASKRWLLAELGRKRAARRATGDKVLADMSMPAQRVAA